MKIKLRKADIEFSKYIRRRDKKCMRCKSQVEFNSKGDPVTHQNSHYFGRGRENTRFDPLNCDTLCMFCHRYWGSDNREDYRSFKIKQLGEAGFKDLTLRANMYRKKDDKLVLLWLKKEVQDQKRS